MENKKIHWVICFLAFLGVLLSTYLSYGHYTTTSLLCSQNGTISCDAVNKSEYSEIFGVPIAFIGVLGYFIIFLINLPYARKKINFTNLIKFDVHTLTLALIAVIFTAYFNYLQLFIIGTICFLCEISAILTVLITLCSLYSYKHCDHKLSFGNKAVVVLVLLLALWLGWYVTPKPLDDFAKCISDEGAVFYGAWWCTHCKTQKSLFSSSFKYVNYVECSNSDKSQNTLCNSVGIKAYPTWKFKNNKTMEGQLNLKGLSEITNCTIKHD